MSSGTFQKILRLLLLSLFILGCLVTAFLMYITSSPGCLNHLVESSEAANNNHQVLTSKNDKNMTTILVWLWPFGIKTEINICSSAYNIEGCFLTADRKFYSKSDGVVIHHSDIAEDLSNLPKSPRPLFQKWMWMNMESPSSSLMLPGINNLFNMTLNYRRDSDIHTPYGSILTLQKVEDFVPPSKDKLVCWIVSNWSPNHLRAKYYNELQKHINVSTYGRAFGKHISNQDYSSTMTTCKFYLSFENSIHQDYISEKLFMPLSMGTVPVVLGTTRQNYENFIPADAFIHVDDFKSPKELADYLLLLDKDEELYFGYFKWRHHYEASISHSWVGYTCQACAYLRQHKGYRAFNNLNKWYWG